DLSEKMHYSGQLKTETHQLEKECEEAFLEASQLAEELSEQRKGGSEAIEKNLKDLLHRVGLPNASIQIEWTSTELHSSGKDKADILFDANKTGRYGSISKIASGGELSRIMLCLKSMLAGSASLPTLIFDEIDTGISGETAIQVGRILKELSEKHQLICITHLPQIAGMADQHFYIYKEAEPQGEMHTSLRLLNEDERVNTLAEMLSGKASGERERDMVRQILKSR
ncbi:MAG TPA: DNA repair protein RecN, partial [Chitinophagaceae bacterium]|nr:DNA repair protein RecN [Chitinophagaceae bacterium]